MQLLEGNLKYLREWITTRYFKKRKEKVAKIVLTTKSLYETIGSEFDRYGFNVAA